MKRTLKFIIISLTMLVVLSVSISYALSNENISNNFISLNKQEIALGDTLQITIDLNKIEWSKFKVELYSSLELNDIYVEEENIGIETNESNVTFEIDKTQMNLDKVVLYFPISEDIKIGDSIKLSGVVTNLEDGSIENKQQKTCDVTVKVTNSKDDETENNKPNNEDNIKENNKTEKNFDENMGKNRDITMNQDFLKKEQSTQNENTTKNTNKLSTNNNFNTEEQVTYNGSNNNYLSTLSINGYELNKEFNKEGSTYFATVGKETTNLEIAATAEDALATVCVYGADNLKEGENKILICVTAENGNVRNYRIYVTKNN